MPVKKKDEKYFLTCPRCGSTNVENDLSRDMVAWNTLNRYLCKNCNYSAPFFPEVSESGLPAFRKNIKFRTKRKKEIIERYSLSKGILNKKLSILLVCCYILAFSMLLLGMLLFLSGSLNVTMFFLLAIIVMILGFAFYQNRTHHL
ncbi:MAG: hypothetical protein HGA85_06585 [Nanoarchaeota archaeon]|nr:hypothetical protein [Nanoarchaeota archaeon]